MPETQQDQPLWAAMCNAYLKHSKVGATVETDAAAWAAEIRAVAERIAGAVQWEAIHD